MVINNSDYQQETNQHNTKCFLVITLATYLSQALFFVNMAGYLSTQKNPLIQLGNVFFLAMIPFVISAFFLAPKVDKLSSKKQMLILVCVRIISLIFLSAGIWMGYEPSKLIYITILFYDLGFFLYQSLSAKITKIISQTGSLRKAESIAFLGVQLGMFGGGLLASSLLKTWSLATIFFLAACIECLGLLVVLIFRKDKVPSQNDAALRTVETKNRLLPLTMARFKAPKTMLALISFALILPLQQTFNLLSGPWAQMQFHDSGQMLGRLIAGIAFGSFLSATLLINNSRFRDAKALVFSPIVTALAIIGIYFSHNIFRILLFAILFGCSYTISRVVIRSLYIETIETTNANAASMIATMCGVILSIIFIFLLTHSVSFKIQQGFFIMIFLAGAQFFFSWLAINCTTLLQKKGKWQTNN